ncbi:Hsp20/alpha crystallin family protein [Emticicia soli]|uniref:Hsp20/alpha crystallin family protein n=1 Tax=Emticicia soli TaxID=2027878 RepID=A0ABW5J9R6_9BACT
MTDVLKNDIAQTNLLSKERVCVPLVKIKRSEWAFELKIVAPGIRKEDFSLEIANGVMIVQGRTAIILETNMAMQYSKAYEYISFSREFLLPQNVDVSKIEVSYDYEILEVHLHRVQH